MFHAAVEHEPPPEHDRCRHQRKRPSEGVADRHAIGNRAIGDRAIGDRDIGDRAIGDRAIGDRAIGDRAIGNLDSIRGCRSKPARC